MPSWVFGDTAVPTGPGNPIDLMTANGQFDVGQRPSSFTDARCERCGLQVYIRSYGFVDDGYIDGTIGPDDYIPQYYELPIAVIERESE